MSDDEKHPPPRSRRDAMLACPFLDHQAKDSEDSDENSSDDGQMTDLSYVSQGSSHPNASPSLYLASLGSQADALGFGSTLANHRKLKPFESSYDPHVRLLAPEGYRGNVCPDGHRCLEHRFKKTRYCDECVAEIPAGTVGQRCSICDYDLCPLCCTRSNPGGASDPVIDPSPALVVPPRPTLSIATATIDPCPNACLQSVVPSCPPFSMNIASFHHKTLTDAVLPLLSNVPDVADVELPSFTLSNQVPLPSFTTSNEVPLKTFNRMKLKRKAPLITQNISSSLGVSDELDLGVVVVTKPCVSPASFVVPDAAAAALSSAIDAASNASAPQAPSFPLVDASYDIVALAPSPFAVPDQHPNAAESADANHVALQPPASPCAVPDPHPNAAESADANHFALQPPASCATADTATASSVAIATNPAFDFILISSASSSPKSHSTFSYPAPEPALTMACTASANPLPASSLAPAHDTHAIDQVSSRSSALSPAPASTQVSTPVDIHGSVLNPSFSIISDQAPACVPVLAPLPVCSSVLLSLISSLPAGVTLTPAETTARAELFRIFHCAGVVPYKHYEMLARNLIFTHGIADSEDLQYMIHTDSAALDAFMTAGQLSCLIRFFNWPPSRYDSEHEDAESLAFTALTSLFATAGVVPAADYDDIALRLIEQGVTSDLSLRDSLLCSSQSFDLPSLMVKPMQAGRIIKFLSNLSE